MMKIWKSKQKKNGIGFSQKKQKEVLDQFPENNFYQVLLKCIDDEIEKENLNNLFYKIFIFFKRKKI